MTPADRPAAGAGALLVGFDLDLTLVDSRERISTCLAGALGAAGAAVTAEQVAPTIGLPLGDAVGLLAPGLDAGAARSAAQDYRRRHDAPGAPPVSALPGAAAALSAVRAAGGRTAVVSAKTGPAVRRVLTETGLAHLADVVVGGRFGAAKGEVLREIGATAYVGDHPGDVVAARTAGVDGLAVLTGGSSEAELRAAGATTVAADLSGFEPWLAGHLVRLGGEGAASAHHRP